MNALVSLTNRLEEIVALEGIESLKILGGYVVGATLSEFPELYENNSLVERISDLGSDLEVENGSAKELDRYWNNLKGMIVRLRKSVESSDS